MPNVPLSDLDASNSILFLGAGFSAEAINLRGSKMPTGHGLKADIAGLLEMSPEGYSLQELAEEALLEKEKDLYDYIYESFTTKQLSTDQASILNKRWMRIYTTRASFVRIESGRIPKALSMSESMELIRFWGASDAEGLFHRLAWPSG